MKCLFFLMPAFSVVQLVSGIGLHLAGSPDEILRPGYGVVFEKEGKVCFVIIEVNIYFIDTCICLELPSDKHRLIFNLI